MTRARLAGPGKTEYNPGPLAALRRTGDVSALLARCIHLAKAAGVPLAMLDELRRLEHAPTRGPPNAACEVDLCRRPTRLLGHYNGAPVHGCRRHASHIARLLHLDVLPMDDRGLVEDAHLPHPSRSCNSQTEKERRHGEPSPRTAMNPTNPPNTASPPPPPSS